MTGLQLLGLLNNLPREDLSKEVLIDAMGDGWYYGVCGQIDTAKVDGGQLDDTAPEVLVLTSDR